MANSNGGINLQNIRQNWGWLLALGIVLIILGILALGSLVFAAIITLSILGWILFVSGLIQLVQTFWSRSWGGLSLHLLAGVLGIVVGLLIIFNPNTTILVLSFILAIFFIVSGLYRLFSAVIMRFPNWGWSFAYGFLAFLLGILIISLGPTVGFVIIGLFIGLELIFNGISWIAVALAAKNLPPPPL